MIYLRNEQAFIACNVVHEKEHAVTIYFTRIMFMQLSNQAIMWATVQCKNFADTVQKLQLMFTSNIRIGKECYLCDFDRGLVVGARWAGLSMSLTVDLLTFLCTAVSEVFTE